MAVFPGSAIPSAADDYTIDQSLRFDDGDSAKLTRTPGSAGDQKTWTLSVWYKKGDIDVRQIIFGTPMAGAGGDMLEFQADNTLNATVKKVSTDATYALVTNAVYRDPGAWMHIVWNVDSTETTESDRANLYVNGEKITSFSTEDYIPLDESMLMNSTVEHQISGRSGATAGWADIDGYLAEFHFIDGQALDASSFGEEDSDTGQWKPIEVTGMTYGTNGFYQSYSNTALANSFTDSAEDHSVTAVGNTHTDTSIKKIGTASAQFDGTGDYLLLPDSPDWALMANAGYTAEAWIYPTSVTGTRKIFAQAEDGSNDWQLYMSDDEIAVWATSGGSAGPRFLSSSSPITINTWQHVALVKDGDDYEIFVAGSSVATATSSVSDTLFADLRIGNDTSDQGFEGYIDEIRISNSARYTGTYTPSTTAFTADSNTLLLVNCDGANDGTTFSDSSGRPRNTITANGDVANTRVVRKIGDSSIKFDGTGDYLSIPASSDFDPGTNFTAECWFRYTADDEGGIMGTQDSSGYNGWFFRITNTTDTLDFNNYGSSGGAEAQVTSGTLSWSVGTWYHIAVVKDGNDYEIFRDGTSVATATDSSSLTSGGALFIGKDYNVDYTNCYMDEIRISNSARYTSSFTPQTTEFTADANTMLLIHSNWGGGLGADSSGNYNYFTPTNLVATDQVPDSPSNNWCIFNSNLGPDSLEPAYSEGSLKLSNVTSTTWERSRGTIGVSSGKWYWEVLLVEGGSDTHNSTGVTTVNGAYGSWAGELATEWFYQDAGSTYNNNVTNSGQPTYTDGDIISVAMDMDAGKLWWAKNDTWINSGNPATGANAVYTNLSGTITPTTNVYESTAVWVANYGQDDSFANNKTSGSASASDANELGTFFYDVPSGFKALCSNNLPDPEIADPSKHFNISLYNGNSSTQSITGVGFQPDFTWIKQRTNVSNDRLMDVIRTPSKYLESNTSVAEGTDATFDSWTSDGFDLDGDASEYNYTGRTYVGWNWKGGGAGVSNDDGSLTSSVSANSDAGFSIVTWTGDTTDATIGHGLSEAPEFITIKSRTGPTGSYNWPSYSKPSGTGGYINLDAGSAWTANSGFYGVAPTASVFNPGSHSYVSGAFDFVAYCFHSVPGYSQIGSFVAYDTTSYGLADPGSFVYTGFRPEYLLTVSIDSGVSWYILDAARDTYNMLFKNLSADTAGAEGTAATMMFYSNGFQDMGNWGYNFGGDEILYIAFAESPFKTANAR